MSTATIRQQYLDYNATRQIERRRYAGFTNELKYFRRLKALSPDLRLLDVGCGSGLFLQFMIEQGAETHGVDIDPGLVQVAKARLEDRNLTARVLVGRVERLPYGDGTFDMCVANSILEHAADWKAALREITRVLKAGGLLVFYTANRLHPFQSEVNHFPFYPWVPDGLKAPLLTAIVKHRPDMVNYTEYPAVNWFTYEQLKRFLVGLGYSSSTRLDLVERSDLAGWKRFARPTLHLRRASLLRRLYYLYSRDVSMYAIKGCSA